MIRDSFSTQDLTSTNQTDDAAHTKATGTFTPLAGVDYFVLWCASVNVDDATKYMKVKGEWSDGGLGAGQFGGECIAHLNSVSDYLSCFGIGYIPADTWTGNVTLDVTYQKQ